MKILNLYAGIGGNRKLWGDEHEVTAVEIDEDIAELYSQQFKDDKILIGIDAKEDLLQNFKYYDFIWVSPPCPTHSRMRNALKEKVYPDMSLWQLIIFLKHNFKGKWVVENVIPYYEPLVAPTITIGRHMFWSNFEISPLEIGKCNVSKSTKEQLAEYHGMPICKRLWLRNCVHPKIGKHILKEL